MGDGALTGVSRLFFGMVEICDDGELMGMGEDGKVGRGDVVRKRGGVFRDRVLTFVCTGWGKFMEWKYPVSVEITSPGAFKGAGAVEAAASL